MPKPSFGGAQPKTNHEEQGDEHQQNSRRIARDLSSLQREIRDDFDQRISDLSNILQKFKTLMVTDLRALNSQAANDDDDHDFPLLTNKIDDATLADINLLDTTDEADEQTQSPDKAGTDPLAAYRETARFEAGLYQLNCQLYRFRLELDQELEYREEPLHVHFSDDSDLAAALKRITDKTLQERNTDN